MSVINPFAPRKDASKTLSASAATSNIQVLDNTTSNSNWNARFYNSGTVTVFISWGSSGVTAAVATGVPLAPGAVEVLTVNGGYVAGITASGTATVYITEGTGI